MRKEGVRVIHTHFGHIACQYLPVALSLELPLITTFYGFDVSVKEVLRSKQSEYTQLFRQGTCFLVEGPHMRDKLISLGCPEEKTFIQRIALDLKQYAFKTRSWDKRRSIRLLFVGRLTEKKGLEYALRALAKIRKKYPIQFRIIGAGALEGNLHSLATNLGFGNEVFWYGILPHKKVIEELQCCDILIQPSVTARNGDSEGGAPTIILEAQACGVPVISTTHADIPYITCPDESALLSSERDIDGLANNVRHLSNNSEIWSHMGKKGREHIERFHNVEREVVALENIYKDSLLSKLSGKTS
jgi:colanic acid/amylovoran biosynthesis glycosyltransferase